MFMYLYAFNLQLNLVQQPRIIIGGDGDCSEKVSKKQRDDEEDDTSSRSSESENAGKMEGKNQCWHKVL